MEMFVSSADLLGVRSNMILRKGNMLDSNPDILLFTGNATIKKDGCLVMGAGAALQVLNRYPGIDAELGGMISNFYKCNPQDLPYGLMIHYLPGDGPYVGVFQVKWLYSNAASLPLIKSSTGMLDRIVRGRWKSITVAMNFPGIGLGRLDRSVVLPVIEVLPDNVEVWEYA